LKQLLSDVIFADDEIIPKTNYNTSKDYQLRAKMPGIGMIGSWIAWSPVPQKRVVLRETWQVEVRTVTYG